MQAQLNILDRAISWVAPSAGLRRVRDRAVLQGSAFRHGFTYEGAKQGRHFGGWNTTSTSANAEIGPALVRLRNSSRDLFRNEPLARKAINEIKTKTIGTGILPHSLAKNKRTRRVIDERFKPWTEECDADGRQTYQALQSLGLKTILESGEVITKYEIPERKKDLLRLRLLEPDYLDPSRTLIGMDTYTVQGVEFDSNTRRRVGYWLFQGHPGDTFNSFKQGSLTSELVDARFVEHGYEVERIGQVRGVPRCAPVIARMRDLGDIEHAIRMKKKVEACFAAFLHEIDPGDSIGNFQTEKDSQSNLPVVNIEPGTVKTLRGNQNITFANPSGNGAEPEYVRLQQRVIAAGWLVPYEVLTGDLSQINYSSYRGGLLGFRDMIEELRWNVVVPWICTPVYRRFVDMLYLNGEINEPDYAVEWSEPAFDMLDRNEESKADISQVRAGSMSWGQMVSRQGLDPDAQFDELVAWKKRFDTAGIVLDGDPARVDQRGRDQQAGAAASGDPQPGA